MAAPVTLSTLITRVTQRANIEKFVAESGALINNPEIRDYLNEAIQELYDILIEARGQEFYRKAYTFATNPNVSEYSLPPDFYELLSVDLFVAPNLVLTARPYMESERNAFRYWSGWVYPMPLYYRILGSPQSTGATLQPSRINFIPQPAAINTVVLNYYPRFRPFATDGTEDNFRFDGIAGWENFAVWKVVAFCLEKMEQNSEFAMARAAEIEQRIRDLAVDRDAGNAERVHDVGIDYEPFGFGGTGGG